MLPLRERGIAEACPRRRPSSICTWEAGRAMAEARLGALAQPGLEPGAASASAGVAAAEGWPEWGTPMPAVSATCESHCMPDETGVVDPLDGLSQGASGGVAAVEPMPAPPAPSLAPASSRGMPVPPDDASGKGVAPVDACWRRDWSRGDWSADERPSGRSMGVLAPLWGAELCVKRPRDMSTTLRERSAASMLGAGGEEAGRARPEAV
mmetsp:Transcript_22741/g.86157  ORF Transcript_22741/g.86157 Transcript_22741/m.86157 type:complete len:209 (+) Transcript_22741:246-872(+)